MDVCAGTELTILEAGTTGVITLLRTLDETCVGTDVSMLDTPDGMTELLTRAPVDCETA
jgi:hypothetical protein